MPELGELLGVGGISAGLFALGIVVVRYLLKNGKSKCSASLNTNGSESELPRISENEYERPDDFDVAHPRRMHGHPETVLPSMAGQDPSGIAIVVS